MDTLIRSNLYLILISTGGVLVCLHAHTLYSTSVAGAGSMWPSNEMRLQHLTGRRQFATGYLCYVTPVLLLYLLLSVSPEILHLSMGIAGTQASVGALTLSSSEAQLFAPLLAATAVITLTGVAPFSRLERSIRGVSHGIAGIPRYVQDIAGLIRRMDLREPSSGTVVPGTRPRHPLAMPGLDSDVDAIRRFNEWIFGDVGGRVWSEKANQALELAKPQVLADHEVLKRRLLALERPDGPGDPADDLLSDESYDEAARLAREVRVRYTRLLALLVANQDEPIPRRNAPRALTELVSAAQKKRATSRLGNGLITGTLVGFAVSLSFATLFYLTLTVVTDLVPANQWLAADGNTLLVGGMPLGEFYASSAVDAFHAAWWDVLGTSLLFASGCAAGLAYRASRESGGEWERWHARSHPVSQYVVVALLAVLCAAFFYESFLFFKLVVWPSAQVLHAGHFASMLKDFGSDYVAFGFLSLLSAPAAVLICLLGDAIVRGGARDDELYASGVWLIVWFVAIGGTGTAVLAHLLIGDARDVPDALVKMVVPLGTLFLSSMFYWRVGLRGTYRARPAAGSLGPLMGALRNNGRKVAPTGPEERSDRRTRSKETAGA